jgi:hypothetical protein
VPAYNGTFLKEIRKPPALISQEQEYPPEAVFVNGELLYAGYPLDGLLAHSTPILLLVGSEELYTTSGEPITLT